MGTGCVELSSPEAEGRWRETLFLSAGTFDSGAVDPRQTPGADIECDENCGKVEVGGADE
jgi:hypothetical protein